MDAIKVTRRSDMFRNTDPLYATWGNSRGYSPNVAMRYRGALTNERDPDPSQSLLSNHIWCSLYSFFFRRKTRRTMRRRGPTDLTVSAGLIVQPDRAAACLLPRGHIARGKSRWLCEARRAKTRSCAICVRSQSNVVSPTQSGRPGGRVHAGRTCIHTTSHCLLPLRCFPGSFSDVVCARPSPPALHIVSPRALPSPGWLTLPSPFLLLPLLLRLSLDAKRPGRKHPIFFAPNHAPCSYSLFVMEQQLNLGHLLTAARLLDIGALDISSLDLGALTSSSSSPGSTSPVMFDVSNGTRSSLNWCS